MQPRNCADWPAHASRSRRRKRACVRPRVARHCIRASAGALPIAHPGGPAPAGRSPSRGSALGKQGGRTRPPQVGVVDRSVEPSMNRPRRSRAATEDRRRSRPLRPRRTGMCGSAARPLGPARRCRCAGSDAGGADPPSPPGSTGCDAHEDDGRYRWSDAHPSRPGRPHRRPPDPWPAPASRAHLPCRLVSTKAYAKQHQPR